LGWKIVHTPNKGGSPDLTAIRAADVYLLLMGSDIRAPIGLELLAARRSAKKPELLLKKNVPRTPAAQVFVREMKNLVDWQYFKDGAELRQKALQLMADHILNRPDYYHLQSAEYNNLRSWQEQLAKSKAIPQEEIRGGAGKSGMIFSIERYEPSEGVLLNDPKKTKHK